MLRSTLSATLLGLVLLLPPSLRAQGLGDVVSVEVLPGWRTEEGHHMAGFRIRLAPGWKTYWRAPGDSGIPPLFDWTGSSNVAGAAFHWPVPQVSWPNGMRTIGYAREVTLPVRITLDDPEAPARLAGRVQLGVCEDVCIPATLDFDAALPASGGARHPAIVAALVDVPLSAEAAGVGAVVCRVSTTEDGLRVTARMEVPRRRQTDIVVIEAADPEVWVSEPEVERDGTGMTAEAELIHISGQPFALDRSGLRFTLLGPGGQAVDIRGCSAG